MRKTFFTLVLISCFILTSTLVGFGMETSQWKEDINYLQENLAEKHKNIYFNLNEEEYNKLFNNLLSEIDEMNEKEIIFNLTHIFSEIEDPHTGISIRPFVKECYPIFFKKFGKHYHVVAAHEKYEDYIGAQLVSINGNNLDKIITGLDKVIVNDNKAGLLYQAQNFLNMPALLKYCDIIENNIEYTLKKDDEIFKIKPKKVNYNKFVKEGKIAQLEYDKSIANKNSNKFFWYDYLKDDNLLYFQYNVCWSRELEKRHRGHDNPDYPYFKKTAEELLTLLKNNTIDKFVIDLRHNSGGSSSQGTTFAKKLGKLDIDTQTYVIIGNRTFSSAIINAVHFKQYDDAILVGEPTKGKPNHYGEVKSFKLPNSELNVSYSTKYFEFMEDDPASLYPDILVRPSYENYVDGEDNILEKIMEL
jgi:hypothetical protein